MLLLCEPCGKYRSLKMPCASVIMLPVDCMFLPLYDCVFALSRALLGVDFELSFRAVFGNFLPLSSPVCLLLPT